MILSDAVPPWYNLVNWLMKTIPIISLCLIVFILTLLIIKRKKLNKKIMVLLIFVIIIMITIFLLSLSYIMEEFLINICKKIYGFI